MNSIIQLQDVHKTYNGGGVHTKALRGIDLAIDRGFFTCLVGPSGHGKSTLLHLIGGLDKPTQGTVTVLGQQISSLSDRELARFRAHKVGFVFQFFNLLKGLTVRENVQLSMMYAGLPSGKQAERASELLGAVGLGDKMNARANKLSGGQMQRVAIARALANNPDILLLDEPTGNLDSASEKEVMEILHNLHQQGRTIVMVTHNLEIAAQAQQVIKIMDGQAVC